MVLHGGKNGRAWVYRPLAVWAEWRGGTFTGLGEKMTPEQIQQLIVALKEIATGPKSYTLTGAADWPLLVIVGGAVVALICFMWADLRSSIKDGRTEWKTEVDRVWQAMRECQDDCCPRGKK